MSKIAIAVFTFFCFFFLSCKPLSYEEYRKKEKEMEQSIINSFSSRVYYRQDKKTGLCYALFYAQGTGFAHVPCSPEVMKLVTKAYFDSEKI